MRDESEAERDPVRQKQDEERKFEDGDHRVQDSAKYFYNKKAVGVPKTLLDSLRKEDFDGVRDTVDNDPKKPMDYMFLSIRILLVFLR